MSFVYLPLKRVCCFGGKESQCYYGFNSLDPCKFDLWGKSRVGEGGNAVLPVAHRIYTFSSPRRGCFVLDLILVYRDFKV